MKVESVYIQITTRCNILCPYCVFDCTAEGEDMSFKDFRKIVAPLNLYGVMLGGGEPTIHPSFWQMFHYLWDHSVDRLVVTNGQRVKTALRLAKLAKESKCATVLSLDSFHKRPIHKVLKAFESGLETIERDNDCIVRFSKKPGDRRKTFELLNEGIVRVGRAVENNLGKIPLSDRCYCRDGLFVSVHGDLYSCSCGNHECYGNVLADPCVFKDLPDVVRRPYTFDVYTPLVAA